MICKDQLPCQTPEIQASWLQTEALFLYIRLSWVLPNFLGKTIFQVAYPM